MNYLRRRWSRLTHSEELDITRNLCNLNLDEETGEEKQMKMTKPEAFKWFESQTDFILAELQSSGFRIEPKPLPSLAPLFKKFRDEL